MTDTGLSNVAAQYLRMSTEHQRYSFQNQSDAIRSYADRMGFTIEKTYSDAGKSGLGLRRRDGLRQLLNDVVSGTKKYSTILVYDVSRWGRFQDVDEAAHYEFLCRAAGIAIHYCAEQFANDNSLSSSIMKGLKRVMAGEYSRELSTKVHEGAKRVCFAGFRTGGPCGYGLRRLLVSANREPKCILDPHERKSLQSDRVILVPGPDSEVRCVRDIFRMFTDENMLPLAIAAELTRQGIPYPGARRKTWYGRAVTIILRHPKYTGCSVFGQSRGPLQTPRVSIPRAQWTITAGAWQPLVDQSTFDRAQKRFERLAHHWTDSELLLGLRRVFQGYGMLSKDLVDQSSDCPTSETYARRFGSLSEAFEKVGYLGSRLDRTRTKRAVRALRDDIVAQIVATNPSRITIIRPDGHFRPRIRVSSLLVPVFVCLCWKREAYDPRWYLRPIAREQLALIIRLNAGNKSVMDVHLVPSTPPWEHFALRLDDPWLRQGKRLNQIADFLYLIDLMGLDRARPL